MRNFHAKTACDSRVYEYLLPSYTLMPRKPVDLSKFEVQPEQKFIELPAATPEEMAQKRAYRISDDQLAHVQSILEAFVGTHNFHNYTIGRHYKDKASNRYIMSFKVKSPFTLIFSEIWSQAQINLTLFTLII
jgi:tRNA pseudouridine38-40 synthase